MTYWALRFRGYTDLGIDFDSSTVSRRSPALQDDTPDILPETQPEA